MVTTTWRDVGDYLEDRLRADGRDAVMTYGELLEVFTDLPEFNGAWLSHPLCDMFYELDVEDAAQGRPFRTALVVSKDERLPGAGFFKMYSTHRNPRARLRTDMDRLTVHQQELQAVASHYGHP
jgi:hypothetical protein